nr:beta-propeller domain-containing protein [Micromonospora sp. DSM 115978]
TTNSVTTDNGIVVLEVRGQQLTEVGKVGGLGVGEQIYAVRYLGDVAWVVTFRQTDPLYAVDLSDPTRPVVRGELKLPGFSTFLLPLPDDRLLGVGESAEGPSGGTKLALFDISDLSAPRLLDDEIVAG